MIKLLKGKKVLIGVCGGIAAYKVCSVVNNLIKNEADVRVIMTESATKFVAPITFQALTGHAVHSDMFLTLDPEKMEHVWLAKWPDVILIAPATTSTIGKIANGIADNLLTTVVAASPQKTKVLIAPAMNVEMWNNPILQKNILSLSTIGKYFFIEPRSGILACRDEGIGKIADIEKIVEMVSRHMSKK